jgi:S1-C subfamily serine protease
MKLVRTDPERPVELTAGGRSDVGDELVQYAGVRVFSTADLQLLTASGRLGETVAVEVVRGGQPLSLRAVRGPLGIVLDPVQRAPEGGC